MERPMLLEHNKQPMSLRHGHVFLEGVEVMDSVSCEVKFTPEVSTSRQLGDLTPDSRWHGYVISGSITRRRTTPWMKDVIKKYIASGITPEFKIQGIQDDPGSDYGAAFGPDTVTAVGVILSGDLSLINLDANGDIYTETINFTAKDIV